MGNNSTTDNISAINLINTKKVTKRRVGMQWFKVPPRIYHEMGSIQYLQKLHDVNKVKINKKVTIFAIAKARYDLIFKIFKKNR